MQVQSYGQRNKKNKTVNLLSLHPLGCYNPFESIYAFTACTLSENFTANIETKVHGPVWSHWEQESENWNNMNTTYVQ